MHQKHFRSLSYHHSYHLKIQYAQLLGALVSLLGCEREERGTTVSGGASNRQVWCNLYEDGKWNKWQGKSKKFWDMSLVQQMTHFCYLEILFWLEMFLFKIVLVYSNTTKYCTLNIHFCIEKFYFRTITVFYVLEEGFTTVT